NERRKKKLVVYTLSLLMCFYLLFSLLFDDMGLIKYVHLKKNEDKLILKISSIKKENIMIRKEIKLLRANPFYIEKHARENLNLARPDEYIFLYEK
ncbi:MAG TPA: septum formation initiator family protein, partial [Nitrospirae bacterium]|nr:septum formation initiator family protein [Nitrospirota bacterium]